LEPPPSPFTRKRMADTVAEVQGRRKNQKAACLIARTIGGRGAGLARDFR
jgi:hypothetical protein